MELFTAAVTSVIDLMRIDFTLFGYTFSLWQVFLFSIIAGAVAGAVGWFFFD